MSTDRLHPTNQKKFEDWTWDDLRTHCAWSVASCLLKGEGLFTAMHSICHTVCEWERQRVAALAAEKKKARKKR